MGQASPVFSNLPPSLVPSGEVASALGLATQSLAFLPLAEARLGMRQAALIAIAWKKYRRAVILTEAAARLPMETVHSLVPSGRRIATLPDLDALVLPAQAKLEAGGLQPVCQSVHRCPNKRPWRSLVASIEGLPYVPAQREELLSLALRLAEPEAWLLQAYLRLALRKDEPIETIAVGLFSLLEGWRRFFEPHRQKWCPWPYVASKQEVKP